MNMGKGLSTKRELTKKPVKGKIKEKEILPEQVKKITQTIRTAGDLDIVLRKINVEKQDNEEILEEALDRDIDNLEDNVEPEDSDEEDLTEEHDEWEDDYTDYDEQKVSDPFDIEGKDTARHSIYIAEVLIIDSNPSVRFSKIPVYDTPNELIRNTLYERYKVFNEMAHFIVKKQKGFFLNPASGKLANLNQEDLVKYFKNKKYNLTKHNISRMLNSLLFRMVGLGYIPAKALFKRYGYVTGLSKDDKLSLAREFLKQRGKGLSQLEKARKFREFIKKKEGREIKLSNASKESDRYRTLINILRKAEEKK